MLTALQCLLQAPFILFLIFLAVMGVAIDVWDRYFRKV